MGKIFAPFIRFIGWTDGMRGNYISPVFFNRHLTGDNYVAWSEGWLDGVLDKKSGRKLSVIEIFCEVVQRIFG